MKFRLSIANVINSKLGFKTLSELWLTIVELFRNNLHENRLNVDNQSERNLRVLLSGGSSVVVKTIGLLTNLVIIPLAINSLGSEKYGILITIFSFYAFIWFTDLGLGNSLLYRIVNLKSDNFKKDLNIAISSTFYSLVFIAFMVALFIGFMFSHINFARLYNINNVALIDQSKGATLVLLFVILVNIPLGIVMRIQEGFQAGFIYQFWSLIGTIVSALIAILLIKSRSSMSMILLGLISGSSISNIFAAVFALRKKSVVNFPRLSLYSLKMSKTILRDGLFFFLIQTFTTLFILSDNLIITQLYGPINVTDFDVVKKMFYASFFTQYFISPLMPAFGQAINSGDTLQAKNMYIKVARLSVIVSFIFGLPLFLFGRNIISIWIGASHIPTWGLLLSFYINTLLMNYTGICSAFFQSGKLLRVQLPLLFSTCFIGIILKIFLCKYFGLPGVMWGNILGYVICFAIPAYIIISRFFDKHQSSLVHD